MGFKCGIVGLPNVGKSTLFNALTSAGVPSANYPFCTIEPNVGIVEVPDPRLRELEVLVHPQRTVPVTMEFVDIAGLVKGAARGEGLGNKFLGHIRSTEAVAHVVRCFEDGDITHVEGSVDPLRDIDIIQSELIFADNETVETALNRQQKLAKSGKKSVLVSLKMLEALHAHLQSIKPARIFDLTPYVGEEAEVALIYRDLHLLTAKPVVYVCNVEEALALGDKDNDLSRKVVELAKAEGAQVVRLCGRIEEELTALGAEDRQEMLEAMGLKEPGLNRLIRCGYEILGLRTYFTAGEKEVRAWTFRQGAKAPQAAGVIHSDFERGFICAEVYRLEDLRQAKTKAKLKELGLLRIEGKEYVVADGDIMEFRFNV